MNKYYTVDEVAELLTMHPKTIQRYIREGKIQATKVGKSWRITEAYLKAFTKAANEKQENKKKNVQDKVLVSSVVDILVQDLDKVSDLERLLVAMLNSKQEEFGKSTMHFQYLEYEGKARITLWGNLQFMQKMMEMISVVTEQVLKGE